MVAYTGVDVPHDKKLSLEEACAALGRGELLLFPTETFYAIGCSAFNPDAVARIFSLKKRSLSLPLPLVMGAMQQVELVSGEVSQLAERLMRRFWPGPLSLVLPANELVPDLLTANAGRVAVRLSPHPAVLNLCKVSGMVLVASSANISGVPPVAKAEQLDPALVEGTAGIYEYGPDPEGGLPSTVVDTVFRKGRELVRVLRQGAVSEAELTGAGFIIEDISRPAFY